MIYPLGFCYEIEQHRTSQAKTNTKGPKQKCGRIHLIPPKGLKESRPFRTSLDLDFVTEIGPTYKNRAKSELDWKTVLFIWGISF